MLPQWIPAPKALALLQGISDGGVTEAMILNRARSGDLKSSARLLNIEGDSRQGVILKPDFWDWTPYSESRTSWEVGDFSASIDGLRHDAIGVSFDLSGLRDMLPFEQRSDLVRKASVAGDPLWMTARAARAFMYTELRVQPANAGALLIDQCKLGFVSARAVLKRQADSDYPDAWTTEEREWDIPNPFWENFTHARSSSQNWESGVFAGNGQSRSGRCWITLSGVHFARKSMDAMLPSTSFPRKEETTAASGGRPPAAFWDDLWCTVWGEIYRGDLKPKNPAEVTKVMLEWAVANGHELSSSSAKPRARKLFDAYQSEGRNL